MKAEELIGGAHQMLSAEEAQRAALEYISRGWAVTAGPGLDALGVCTCAQKGRCRNPGKHAYAGWGNGERRTLTADQAELYWSPKNAYWKDRPVDQVFIVPYLSGLVVADVDNMDKWLALDESMRPATKFQRSGSGRGGHFLYRMDWDRSEAEPPRLPGKLPGGAGEIKFRGVIVAAPSVHPSGGRYRWDEETWAHEIPEVPQSLITRAERVVAQHNTWDTIMDADRATIRSTDWVFMLFKEAEAGFLSAAEATTARPVVLFAVAASMAVWIDAGWITEEEVMAKLLDAAETNGALDTYGEEDMKRQIRNGIDAGRTEKRI